MIREIPSVQDILQSLLGTCQVFRNSIIFLSGYSVLLEGGGCPQLSIQAEEKELCNLLVSQASGREEIALLPVTVKHS